MTDVRDTHNKLTQLEAAATPGPWEYHDYGNWIDSPLGRIVPADTINSEDAELIATMRNQLPRLLAIVEAAENFVDAHTMQAKWRDDYEFPTDEFNALRDALDTPT